MSDDEDIRTMVEALRFIQEVEAADALEAAGNIAHAANYNTDRTLEALKAFAAHHRSGGDEPQADAIDEVHDLLNWW